MYFHSPEMGSSSNVSPWSVAVPSLYLAAAYAALALPLVALDAFHHVADDTALDSNGTLLALDGTPRPTAGTLPAVDSILDDHLSGIERAVH